MLFKKKNEEILKKLYEQFQRLERGIAEERRQLEDLGQNMNKLQAAVHKHDMAIEDLLEEWEGKQSDEAGVKEQFRTYEKEIGCFRDLVEAYQEQFWNLKRFAGEKDETWASQIALMEGNLERYRQLCGIVIIGEPGAQVDYNLHEVIETVETKEADLDKKVADIYSCGYIYKGKVQKKARVAAYLAESRN